MREPREDEEHARERPAQPSLPPHFENALHRPSTPHHRRPPFPLAPPPPWPRRRPPPSWVAAAACFRPRPHSPLLPRPRQGAACSRPPPRLARPLRRVHLVLGAACLARPRRRRLEEGCLVQRRPRRPRPSQGACLAPPPPRLAACLAPPPPRLAACLARPHPLPQAASSAPPRPRRHPRRGARFCLAVGSRPLAASLAHPPPASRVR